MKELLTVIDWKSLLLAEYKTIGLNEEEVMVLLMTDYCLMHQEKLVTPDLLSLKMVFDYKKLDHLMSGLLKRGLITLEEDDQNQLHTSLYGVQSLLLQHFISSQTKRDTRSDNLKEAQSSILAQFEQEFARPLSYVELETIRFWFEEGYESEKILLALKKASEAKIKNIRYMDKILLEWRQQEERSQEGYTTISEKWRSNIEETIKIANVKWVDNDK